MKNDIAKLESLTRDGLYDEAYLLGKQLHSRYADHSVFMTALRALSERLRNDCWRLASNKATEFSSELKEKEALLKQVGVLTGQGPYG